MAATAVEVSSSARSLGYGLWAIRESGTNSPFWSWYPPVTCPMHPPTISGWCWHLMCLAMSRNGANTSENGNRRERES
jgi:hypothetical protein